MQITYTLTLDDFLQLSRQVAQRRAGMSLWLLYLCGFTLGPVGLLGIWVDVMEIQAHHHFLWGEGLGNLFFLFFIGTALVAVWYSPPNLRRLVRSRVRQSPALLQERVLYLAEMRLLESAPGTIEQFLERSQADPPASDKEIQRLFQDAATLTVDWNSVMEIAEDKTAVYILADTGVGFIIPKRIFEDPADLPRLQSHLMTYWETAKPGTSLPAADSVWPPPPTFPSS